MLQECIPMLNMMFFRSTPEPKLNVDLKLTVTKTVLSNDLHHVNLKAFMARRTRHQIRPPLPMLER
jgi:hypothetical protein